MGSATSPKCVKIITKKTLVVNYIIKLYNYVRNINLKMEEEYRNHGKILVKWHFPESEKPERPVSWYIVSFIISILLLLYSVITANFLFAVIIVMVIVILLLNQRKDIIEIDIEITGAGIEVGEKFYPYKDLSKFFIIYEPPTISNLYFEFKSKLKPALSIPLKKQNPVKIRDILIQFLEENIDMEEEPTSDFLTRWLKF